MESHSARVVERARQLIKDGVSTDAIALLGPHLDANPDDLQGWSALSAAHFNLKQWSEARVATEQTVRLDPENPRHWCNLGTIHRKAGNVTAAARAQRHALELDPLSKRANAELRKLHQLRHVPPPLPAQTGARNTAQPALSPLLIAGVLAAVSVIVFVIMWSIYGDKVPHPRENQGVTRPAASERQQVRDLFHQALRAGKRGVKFPRVDYDRAIAGQWGYGYPMRCTDGTVFVWDIGLDGSGQPVLVKDGATYGAILTVPDQGMYRLQVTRIGGR